MLLHHGGVVGYTMKSGTGWEQIDISLPRAALIFTMEGLPVAAASATVSSGWSFFRWLTSAPRVLNIF